MLPSLEPSSDDSDRDELGPSVLTPQIDDESAAASTTGVWGIVSLLLLGCQVVV